MANWNSTTLNSAARSTAMGDLVGAIVAGVTPRTECLLVSSRSTDDEISVTEAFRIVEDRDHLGDYAKNGDVLRCWHRAR